MRCIKYVRFDVESHAGYYLLLGCLLIKLLKYSVSNIFRFGGKYGLKFSKYLRVRLPVLARKHHIFQSNKESLIFSMKIKFLPIVFKIG